MQRRFEVRSANPKVPAWVAADLVEAKREADRMAAAGRSRIVTREIRGEKLAALHVRTTEGTFTSSISCKQLRQLGDVSRDPTCLVGRQGIGARSIRRSRRRRRGSGRQSRRP